MRRTLRSLALAFLAAAAWLPSAGAQTEAPEAALGRAFQLEGESQPREAAAAYRRALTPATMVQVVLGLERVYAELGWPDSLTALLDSLIATDPEERTLRDVQLRTLRAAGREAEAREAYREWVAARPGDPRPYAEYARILLQSGRLAEADTVLQEARRVVGEAGELALELAQLHAAKGEWVDAARAWRIAVGGAPYLDQAALYSLVPTPSAAREDVRTALTEPPAEPGPRRVLALLELHWGSPHGGWAALEALRPDSAGLAAWEAFAERAEQAGAVAIAHEAWAKLFSARQRPADALRAANAALDGGDLEAALRLATLGAERLDSAAAARDALPVQVRALASLGRPAEAERLVGAYHRWLTDDARQRLARAAAWGWVRTGDIARARAALDSTPGEEDPAAAGWLALYEGDLKQARIALRLAMEGTPAAIGALSLLGRTTADRAPMVGAAYLALARGDSAAAARAFEEAAEELPEAASLLLMTAARLHSARRDDGRAISLWTTVIEHHASAPEAPEADLEWARALRRRGDDAAAVARLEHLILTYPTSALLPQARRELDAARSGIPRTS